jgi:hypothetical protein
MLSGAYRSEDLGSPDLVPGNASADMDVVEWSFSDRSDRATITIS